MATANERQYGGEHYKGAEYQHWDWVSDCKMHYLAGCASKYVYRWRSKNGTEDLQKGVHYVDKAEELHIVGSTQMHRMANFWRFVLENNVPMLEAMICYYIQEAEWEAARAAITLLLQDSASESEGQSSHQVAGI